MKILRQKVFGQRWNNVKSTAKGVLIGGGIGAIKGRKTGAIIGGGIGGVLGGAIGYNSAPEYVSKEEKIRRDV